MTLARSTTLHPKPFPMGPPPPPPSLPPLTEGSEPAKEQLLFRTGKSIRRAFSTRRSSPQASIRRQRAVSSRIDMISSPVLHHDDEGKTLKSLAKMGVILGNDIGPGVKGGEVAPLQAPRSVSKVEWKLVPQPPPVVEEPVIKEVKITTTTTKKDKRRGFVFDGLDGTSSLEIPPPSPVSNVMDWKLHNVPDKDEDEEDCDGDEDMDGQESPVSSSYAHEADPVDSMRWSFLAPPSIYRKDSLCLERGGEGGEEKEGGEDVKEMQRELESVETLLGSLATSFGQGMVNNNTIRTSFGGSYKDLKTDETPSENTQKTKVTNSRPSFAEESPTLGHCPTLHIIKRIEIVRNRIETASNNTKMTRNNIETPIIKPEEMIDKLEVSTSIEKKTEVNKSEPLQRPETKRHPTYISITAPEESLRAVLSSPTSRKSFSDYLDSMNSGNSSSKRDSNILRLWLAARAHSAALQYAAQLAEEIKSTCCQEFPDILEPAQNTETVEVSKIEDKVFNEMLQNDFPEFRRQSQTIPKEIQDSLDKLVSPSTPKSPEEMEQPHKRERHYYPISIIDNAIAEQNSELALRKEAMLDSLIKSVPSMEPVLVMKVSGGHQRKIQLSSSKHRSLYAVQSFKIDEAQTPVTEPAPEILEIPTAYRNSAPSSVNMPVLKPIVVERTVEKGTPINVTEVAKANPVTAIIVDTPTPKPLDVERAVGKNTLVDAVKSEIMSKVTCSQPVVEKSDLAAMGIVKRNRALLERMAALEGSRV